MFPPCISVNEYLIPETRKRVAKILIKNGIKENEIAKKFHISQGMVSRYINQKNSTYLDSEIDEISTELAKRILDNYGDKDNTELFCNFCIKTRETGKFCQFHNIEHCDLCFYLYDPQKNYEKNIVIQELISSLKDLSKLNINELMPEVRMNIVYSIENPNSVMDVAAFPGRLTFFNNEIIAYKNPEFGASKHMSNILISSNKKDKNKRAAINIRLRNDIIERLKEMGEKTLIMDRSIYKNVEDFIEHQTNDFDAIIDPGSFGIEPVIYIFAESPKKIVEKLKKILKKEA